MVQKLTLQHIYIYNMRCWVNKWSTFWGFRVNNWSTFTVNKRSTSETTIKIMVSEDFCKSSFQRGFKVFVVSGVLVEKKQVFLQQKGMVTIPFFNFWVVAFVGGC